MVAPSSSDTGLRLRRLCRRRRRRRRLRPRLRELAPSSPRSLRPPHGSRFASTATVVVAVVVVVVAVAAAHYSAVGVVSAASSESTPLYLRSAYPLWEPQPGSSDAGERLRLTGYLERGNVDEARKVARVGPGLLSDRLPSYSGYLTIDRRYNSNLFFWFFPSQDENEKAPLILWLQGGPGASSLYGLFEEIGPFSVTLTGSGDGDGHGQGGQYSLRANPYSWNRNYSLLFVDNPVGTGFSYTEHADGYATNHSTVSRHLYAALRQFYKMFPEHADRDFYLAGESYAGKYVPSLARLIHDENDGPGIFYVNLKGVMIGNGFTDPATMLAYSEYAYQLGLVDSVARDEMRKFEAEGKKAIREGHFVDAFYSWSGVLSTFVGASQFQSLYNALHDRWTWNATGSSAYVAFVQRAEVRRALHVGDAEYTSLGVVYYKMIPDLMTDVRPALRTVLDHYPALFYGGQFDIVCAYPLTHNLFDAVEFAGRADYRRARRRAWYVDGRLAGYVKTAANLTEALVRNAGHVAAHDKPEWTYRLIDQFIRSRPSSSSSSSSFTQ